MKTICDIDSDVLKAVRRGVAIPAQVLALNEDGSFAPNYQRALCRYFIDSGVGGIAVGVHSTQFAIRDPNTDSLKPCCGRRHALSTSGAVSGGKRF